MTHELWILKYRPQSLEEYVWQDKDMRDTVESWLSQHALPHCLLSGHPGSGKTSLVLLLLDLLEIPFEDVLRINASRERKIDDLQDKIINFVDAWAFNPSGLKYVFLDEADKLSNYAQNMLRNEMETYPNCRFLMTCNEPRKILAALHSRLQEIKFTTLDKHAFVMRASDVLDREQITYEPEMLIVYVDRFYPDLRKCIGTLQQNSRDGRLVSLAAEIGTTVDYLPKVIDLFKSGRYLDARKLLISRADPEDYIGVFRHFYQHLDWFGSPGTQQDRALLVIRDAMLNHSLAADQEINMAACIAELSLIARKSE